jgi:hypothetical protein
MYESIDIDSEERVMNVIAQLKKQYCNALVKRQVPTPRAVNIP